MSVVNKALVGLAKIFPPVAVGFVVKRTVRVSYLQVLTRQEGYKNAEG